MDKVIPEDVRQFILQYIDSIAQIEGLLIFCADPQKEWNTNTLARGLFIDESQAAAILTQLFEQGFIVLAPESETVNYHYKPKSSELKEMVERVAGFYRECLIPVTNLIHSKSQSRIQKFADAFKLRKD